MAKICDVNNCNYPVFGTDKNTNKKYCKRHQWMRTDIVRNFPTPGVKKRMEKIARNKYDYDIFRYGFKRERQLFEHLWITKPHESEISGRDLNHITLFFSIFAHVLDKKNYPMYRLNPDNICLLHPMEHVLIDAGTSAARKNYCKEFPETDFNIFYQKKEILLKEYKELEKMHSSF